MTFREWLTKQVKREDAVGAFAVFAVEAQGFPIDRPSRRDLTFALADLHQGHLADGATLAVDEWEEARLAERDAEARQAAAEEAAATVQREADEAAVRRKADAERAARKSIDVRLEERQRAEKVDAERAAKQEAERLAADAEAEAELAGEPKRKGKGRKAA